MQVLRRQVGIAHRHTQRGMPQDLLQRDDVATAHDEVNGEGVAQGVARLPLGGLDRGFEQHLAEHAQTVGERAMRAPVLADGIHRDGCTGTALTRFDLVLAKVTTPAPSRSGVSAWASPQRPP